MNKVFKLAAGLAVSAGIGLMPASAMAYVSWSLDSGCSTSSASRGNTCTFTNSTGSVTASAWANTGSGQTLETATLRQYSGGLGVVNENEDGSSNNHAADNEGSMDVVLFDFSDLDPSEISLTNVFLGYYSNDSDISVLAYTGNDPFSTSTKVDNVVYTKAGVEAAGWTVVGNYDVDATDNSNPYNQPINTSITSSYWLVGAYNSSFGSCAANSGSCQDSSYLDYVKIEKIKGNLYTPPGNPPTSVPEPASLLLLAGTLAPLAWRRRRDRVAASA